jgi:hypothetical protein
MGTIIMITFNPDKFGYYQVGDRSTYSKLEAIEWSRLNNDAVQFIFNDTAFSAIDCTQEPITPLWEMYKDRARQIREAYDYVVLWYSGGSDSHNMLWAWIEAGLKIDEIATTWNYESTGDLQNHYNAEITNVVLPDIKTLQDKGLEFKFRIVDISQHCIDLFEKWGNQFEYNINCHFSPNNPARSMFRESIKEYKDLIDQGKKVCFVWGKEKPMMGYDLETKRHYFHFLDNSDNCVSPHVQKNYYKGWYDEFFYWTPDYPLIPVKQAHVIRNFINSVHDETLYSGFRHNTNGYSPYNDKFLHEKVVKLLLYPKWSNDIFCNGKTSSFTYSMRDDWFWKSNLEQKNKFIDITNTYFKIVDPNESNKRITAYPYWSRKYWI